MKIYRYNRVSCVPSVMKLEEFDLKLHQKFDESLADLTYFVPTSEAIRSGRRAGDANQGSYDFPDGKDTGMAIPISRRKGHDIAEVEAEVKRISKKVSAAKERIKDYQATQEYINELKSSGASDKEIKQ